MDCDSFVLSIKTQDIINDLKNLENLFDFSNLVENYDLFSEKIVSVKFKLEIPQNIWIDGLICSRSKTYSFKCNDKNTIKLNCISKSYSKLNKLEECEKCLDVENYQKQCDNYNLRSLIHKMCLQLAKKSTLSIFVDKRCNESNIESRQWE